jgi:hypothetical protein
MASTAYLDEFDVDPEIKQVLELALEMTRTSLGLTDDLANGIIAKRIIELARAGERHPDLLCEGALKNLYGHLFGYGRRVAALRDVCAESYRRGTDEFAHRKTVAASERLRIGGKFCGSNPAQP